MNIKFNAVFCLSVVVSVIFSLTVKAQSVPIPNIDVANRGKTLIKQNARGYYFSSATTLGDTVFYCKDMSCYKLIDSNGRVRLDGEITRSGTDQLVKNGKWTEFYATGIPQSVTYYCLGTQSGPVQTYHTNSVLSARYNLAIVQTSNGEHSVKAGLYQEFYENGQKKVEGFYVIKVDKNATDSVYVHDAAKGTTNLKIEKNTIQAKSEKTGKWFEYDVAGKMIKEEEH
ncbi:MAG: hypothetical protein P4L41_14090 [Flavipsychrobacter sp.]|nr:hypothetical protein [Flavipsychrobacter sp.]